MKVVIKKTSLLLKLKKQFMVVSLLAFIALISPSHIFADCLQDCVEKGNGAGECSAICNANPAIDWDQNFDPLQGPTTETFNTLNPFKIAGSSQAEALSTPGGVISRLLVFAFPLGGLILFAMLVWGGFEIMIGSANKKSVDAGKQRITAALVGFALLFSSYWIAQILEVIFGIVILG